MKSSKSQTTCVMDYASIDQNPTQVTGASQYSPMKLAAHNSTFTEPTWLGPSTTSLSVGMSRVQTDPSDVYKATKRRGNYAKQFAHLAITPEIDHPQHILPPPNLKVPKRHHDLTRDQQLKVSFSSQGLARSKSQAAYLKRMNKTSSVPSLGLASSSSSRRLSKYDVNSYTASSKQQTTATEEKQRQPAFEPAPRRTAARGNNAYLSRMKDYSMLAFACKRGGLTEQEGKAYLSKAIMLDNIKSWGKAIGFYKKYLAICQESGNTDGQMLAQNAIGVAYYNLAMGGSENANTTVGLGKGQHIPKYLEKAIEFHHRHAEVAQGFGLFVAFTNLGLAYADQEDYDRSAEYHQDALRLAITLQNTHAQSVAVGNLALVGKKQGDFRTAKACLDKHLRLSRDLGNWTAESLACHQLGAIANEEGNYKQANLYFDEARHIATNNGELGLLKLVSCEIGVSHGNMRLNEYMDSIAGNLVDEGQKRVPKATLW